MGLTPAPFLPRWNSPKVAGVVKFSEPVAHLITAGADFLMVPSRFEPCGLIQLHAMQYGARPLLLPSMPAHRQLVSALKRC